jgi:hypothetical protein
VTSSTHRTSVRDASRGEEATPEVARRRAEDVFVTSEQHTTRIDVLFVVVISVLLAVHLTIFIAVAALAPVTASEARGLAIVHLPVEVARVLVLPFHALLLGSLFVIGRRAAGRWAGFGALLAVLALDLRADGADPVFGPPTAEGGWIAASLLAAGFALVTLPRRRLLAAALVGLASGFFAVAALALPAFLIGIALAAPFDRARFGRTKAVAAFAGVWAIPAAAMQLLWLGLLGPAGWVDRASEFAAEFRPHPFVPYLEQVRLLFAAWHFPAILTFSLALTLFAAAFLGISRYFATPQHGEHGPVVLRVLSRFPPGLWAAGLTMAFCSAWWGLSGETIIVLPNLPILAAATPLITAMAYRGAKWLLTVNRFWALVAIVYLTGLILARTIQLLLTLIHAFQY